MADTSTSYLDTHGGGSVRHPEIHNIFASPGDTSDWDSSVPQALSEESINQLTRELLTSGYLDGAAQYNVGSGSFIQSTTNNGCFGAPNGRTTETDIAAWVTCEVQSFGTGIDWPNDNAIYVVYLLPSVNVSMNGKYDCQGVQAYHSWSAVASLDPQVYPYVVIPLNCVGDNLDTLTGNLSHELIEAATDPISPFGWIDFNVDDPLNKGEASDLCEDGTNRYVYLDDGLSVSRYWSNSDNSCWPLLHTLTLNATGTDAFNNITVANQSIYGNTLGTGSANNSRPYQAVVRDGADVSWQFKSPMILDPAQPGVADVTNDTARHTLHNMQADYSYTVTYFRANLLTVTASPASLMAGDPSLSYTKWVADGTNTSLTAPEVIQVGPAQQYRFVSWSTDFYSTDRTINVLMDQPKTATANYVLQREVTFDQTGIPDGVPWTVTVNGVTYQGPYSGWFDVGSSVNVSFESLVTPESTPGTRYVLSSISPESLVDVELVVGSPTNALTVTGFYKQQHQVTVTTSGLPDPNSATITNNGVALGSVDDSAPLQTWLDHGSSLSLTADSVVNGIDGTQYFLNGIDPVPPMELTTPFTTTLTYETMNELINDAVTQGGISGPGSIGISSSFRQQFGSAEKDMASGHWAAALGALTDFVDHVAAQSGKQVDPTTATALELDALLVYHNALCLGASSLSATQVSNDYASYAQKVAQLGGTVLPPCSHWTSSSLLQRVRAAGFVR